MKDNNGYIRLHRKILESGIYKTEKLFKLAVTLLLLANHKDGKWNGIEIPRGSLVTGRKALSKITFMNESGIYKNLKKLENMRFCNIKSNNEFSVISILKYDQYQSNSNNQSNNEVTTKEQRSNTNKNNKKNKKNNIELSPRVKWVMEELSNSFNPTKRTVDIIDKDFGSYKITDVVKKYAAQCEDDNKTPSTAGLQKWLINARDWNQLEKRDK